jgi:enoyl-CoA hydratase/carnithine racemase
LNDLNLNTAHANYTTTAIADGVATITMNRPDKLNGWTMEMMDAFKAAFIKADAHDDVKAIILTSTGKYYSAGVNLAGTIKIMPPKALRELIIEHNQNLFEAFLQVKKPLLVAVNGPAIGASVTSATLSNYVIAGESATFSTPFAALGIVPEGCSSIHFARLMGEETAQRMLGEEGWKPTATEAQAAGLIQKVVPNEKLEKEAFKIAKAWAKKSEQRQFLGGSELKELLEVNAKESAALADAFLSAAFMKEQGRFLWSKKKRVPAATFFALWASRPVWSLLL